MIKKLKYNIGHDGFISEIGYMEDYTYEADGQFDETDFDWWYKVGGEWKKLTDTEYKERYGTITGTTI